MHKDKIDTVNIESYWNRFAASQELSNTQLEQFKAYLSLLTTWNEKINLTAITTPVEIITYHFEDSLAVGEFVDFSKLAMISDVGTGGGFPGIPLKIKYPHLKIVLIEVIQKKITFLERVIKELGLEGVEVCAMDWRNFLRHTEYPIDLFVSRASLRPEDLVYMFKGASPYQDKQIIYWASQLWQPTPKDEAFIAKTHDYIVGRKRKLIVLEKPQNTHEEK